MISKNLINTLAYGFLVTLAFLFSFRAFAPHLTPDLNSDGAIHVLMASDLKLPQDLYYWGQNRLGSLVPILGHELLKLTNLAPVEAVAYIQYTLLLIGFFCLASLFKFTLTKILFAFVWFLPAPDFTALVGISQPYGPQFALIGLAIVLINRVKTQLSLINSFKNQVLLFGAGICLIISLWISELSILFIGILLVMALNFVFRQIIQFSLTRTKEVVIGSFTIPTSYIFFLVASTLNIFLVLLLGFKFISYAKQNSSDTTNYATFISFVQIQEIVGKLGQSLINSLTFKAYSPFLSFYTILSIVLLFCLAYFRVRQKRQGRDLIYSPWFYLFGASAVLGLFLLCTSWWVYINGVSFRYFVIVYVAGWIAVLLLLEEVTKTFKPLVYGLAILIIVCSGLSLPSYVFSLTSPPPKIEQLQELKKLGKAGFIGEYWSAYVLCAAKPSKLNCTSWDWKGKLSCDPVPPVKRPIQGVRCPRCARRVLKSKTIYVVKNGWLKLVPSEIQQFGTCLVKVGSPNKLLVTQWLNIVEKLSFETKPLLQSGTGNLHE